MKQNIIYNSIEKVSLRPDRVVFYNETWKYDTINECILKRVNNSVGGNQLKRFHNFEISLNARRELSNKIAWLYSMARKKKVKTISGKEIFNFKMNFITVTLPSSQVHCTSEITSSAFNQFLTELRKSYNLVNYVWRLEFQKNGNVHYHIATDVYIDYYILLKVWNRCINKLGYVDRYQEKMKSLTLPDYVKLCGNYGEKNFKEISERYASNVSKGWKIPPSVDVKSCTSGKKISMYIAKYFGKGDKSGTKCNALDTEENSFSLRLWFCSRSLSKLKTISEYVSNCYYDFKVMLGPLECVKKFYHDYCTVFYFQITKLPRLIQEELKLIFDLHAEMMNYTPG
jgi:hypothetical protein